MGTLRDKVYEDLDYLSQLTEVVIGPQNDMLAAVPDRIELSIADIESYRTPTWNLTGALTLYKANLLRLYIPGSHWQYLTEIEDSFGFEVSPDFELDLENKKMTGTITLVKHKHQIDEKRILELAVTNAGRELQRGAWPLKQLKSRAVAVMNTLETDRGHLWLKTAQQGRIASQVERAIIVLLREVILDNKWRVRDTSIIVKIGTWINSYLSELENGVGLVNLTKLKIMVDRDLPVYSIDEVKSAKSL